MSSQTTISKVQLLKSGEVECLLKNFKHHFPKIQEWYEKMKNKPNFQHFKSRYKS